MGAEQASFEDFYLEHEVRLYRCLCMITGSPEEAQDVMQDAFLRVWERWDRVSGMDSPNGYLFTVAMNRVRSRYRSTVRGMRRTLSATRREDIFGAIDDRDVVLRALRGLIPQQRAAVVLTSLLGYTSEEAGHILSMKAATVRTLTTRARAVMKETMGGERP